MRAIRAGSARCARLWTRLQGMGTDTHAGIAAAVCMPTRMPPSTSATTTSPGPRSPGRLQSISRMDGVPEANRKRSLWTKRSRPSLQACLKVVDLLNRYISHTVWAPFGDSQSNEGSFPSQDKPLIPKSSDTLLVYTQNFLKFTYYF